MNSASNSAYVVVSTTVEDLDAAAQMSILIVEKKFAACVQRFPVNSVYHWKGKTEASEEYLLLIKTKADLVDKLIPFIKENHSYKVPEIIVTPIIGGYDKYLQWIDDECQ